MTKRTEREEAIKLAEHILNRVGVDPDDDLAILSRQLLRSVEIIEKLKNDLAVQSDPTLDLINANRDQLLRTHEEAIRRVRGCLELASRDKILSPVDTALLILDALNRFHPMHAESWDGWPEQG